jgi:hypothetical protein
MQAMGKTKLKIRFFTIADYIEEEHWLRAQHQSGWKLVKMTPPCFFTFEQCEPEDVVYRLDYKNEKATDDYMQMYADFGWEYAGKCIGWFYFRKSASQVDGETEGELFSDNESKVSMVQHIIRTRMLPILIVFFGCVFPQVKRSLDGEDGVGWLIAILVVLVIYLYIMLHCGLKLMSLKRKYKDGE